MKSLVSYVSFKKLTAILLSLSILLLEPTEAMQRHPGGRPMYPGASGPPSSILSPAICAGITGLVVGTGIGIGIGALIFNRPWNRGNIGGGIWFGKRRKRDLWNIIAEDDDDDWHFIIWVNKVSNKSNKMVSFGAITFWLEPQLWRPLVWLEFTSTNLKWVKLCFSCFLMKCHMHARCRSIASKQPFK